MREILKGRRKIQKKKERGSVGVAFHSFWSVLGVSVCS